MIEKQNIEFKQIWKDEYFCCMANGNGGTIYYIIKNIPQNVKLFV